MSATRPQIVVLDDTKRALRRLADWRTIDARAEVTVHHQTLSGAALVGALKAANAIMLMRDRTPFTAELLAALSHLRYLVITGTRNASCPVCC